MSHVAEIDMEMKDMDALEEACKELGLELVRGQTTYKWWGRSVGDYPLPQGFRAQDLGRCEHAIRIPGDKTAYEIGVTNRRDGRPGFTLLWDFYNGGYGMEAKVGKNADLLKYQYTAAVSVKNIPRGYRITKTKLPDGRLEIRARK